MENTIINRSTSMIFKTFILLLGIILMSSCEKRMAGGLYKVYDDKMLDELMQEKPELSSFVSVVEKAGLTGTIHAYGTYTLFAPTNEAMAAYLEEKGVAKPEALTQEEAENIVKYHLVRDTIPITTADFIDGRLPAPNFLKKYLTTKNVDGKTYRINRQADIVDKDIIGVNGVLHVVDKVLEPPVNSITETIRNLPDDYSLMKELYFRPGTDSIANILSEMTDGNWFTFFIQDNQSFANAGILSVEDLLVQLRENTPAIDNDDELIRNFIAYHGVNSLLYVTDLLYVSSLQTLVPRQVITFKRSMDLILLNELIQGQIKEAGVPLDRTSDYSDLSCANGVIHRITGTIQIKNRSAYRIYWDVAEQPEIMALKNFRKKGTSVDFAAGDLAEVTWGGKSPGTINYYCGGYSTVLDEKFQYIYGDYLRFNLYSQTTQWIEFKTPVLIEGKYKVWLCYRRELELNLKSIFKQDGYDDQVLPYIFNMYDYMPNPTESGETAIEIDGWKQYNAKKYNSVVISHLLGIIDVQTTGRHTLRFESTTGGRGQQAGNWDMIQFIPIDEDQLWPKVDIKGDWIGPEVPLCEVWPYEECDTGGEEEEPAE